MHKFGSSNIYNLKTPHEWEREKLPTCMMMVGVDGDLLTQCHICKAFTRIPHTIEECLVIMVMDT